MLFNGKINALTESPIYCLGKFVAFLYNSYPLIPTVEIYAKKKIANYISFVALNKIFN
jgi:hypothetical protein